MTISKKAPDLHNGEHSLKFSACIVSEQAIDEQSAQAMPARKKWPRICYNLKHEKFLVWWLVVVGPTTE